jgi:methyl-accepting chemotaxis protein
MNIQERKKSVTIKTKLGVIGVMFLMCIGGLELVVSYSNSVSTSASQETIRRSDQLRTVMTAKFDALKLQMIAMDAIAAKYEGAVDPGRKTEIIKTDALVTGIISELAKFVETDSEKKAQEDFSTAYGDYRILIVNDLMTLIEGTEEKASFSEIDEKIDVLNKKIQDALTVLETSNYDDSKEAEKELSRKLTRLSRIQWVFTGGMVLIIGVMLFVISLSILKPVNASIAMIRDVAQGEGDLTRRLPQGGDELGELSGWFNMFADKLQAMIVQIKSNITVLTETSGSLADLSSDLEQRSSDASRITEKTTKSMGGLSYGMQGVAAACEEAATNVSMVAAATEEMSSTAREISMSTTKARDVVDHAVTTGGRATERVDELGQAAVEISKVTEVINEISEQTNLLALNATIEAARAGEAGKGFAVVANEIKELARQTSEATQEIKRRIESMRSSAEMTVDDIRSIGGVIGEVNDIVSSIAAAVEEQSATTQEIAGNVTQVSQGLSEVNVNVSKSSSEANDVASEIDGISRIAERIFDSSSLVNLKATELSGLAVTLSRFVDGFKV